MNNTNVNIDNNVNNITTNISNSSLQPQKTLTFDYEGLNYKVLVYVFNDSVTLQIYNENKLIPITDYELDLAINRAKIFVKNNAYVISFLSIYRSYCVELGLDIINSTNNAPLILKQLIYVANTHFF